MIDNRYKPLSCPLAQRADLLVARAPEVHAVFGFYLLGNIQSSIY